MKKTEERKCLNCRWWKMTVNCELLNLKTYASDSCKGFQRKVLK
jgi:hypothetical protein